MPLDLNNFLHSWCRRLATAAGLVYLTTPRSLWRNRIVDGVVGVTVTDPATAVSIYGGGPVSYDPVPSIDVQVLTVGTDPAATLARAQQVFEAHLNGDGTPLIRTTIDGYRAADDVADGTWRVIGLDLFQRPGLVGVDATNRQRASFNARLAICKLT